MTGIAGTHYCVCVLAAHFPAEQFDLQGSYENICWDFRADWAWQDSQSRPVPAGFYSEDSDEDPEEPVDEGLSIEGPEWNRNRHGVNRCVR